MGGMLIPNVELRPMQGTDLDAVLAIETEVFPYPWTRGNFSDALDSGYSAWFACSTPK